MQQVSVIMPCLNMASYIEKCIESVISQTLSNIEILVIDAGSGDGTLDILHTYAKKDTRIRVIHSSKKSYGYQVNLGVAAANGEYIGIVDTDDYIMPDMYEMLYHVANETGADYVKGTAQMFYSITNRYNYQIPISQFPNEQYGENRIIKVCPNQMPQLLTMDNFLWGGIYRSDFLKRIRLHESSGAAFQDLGGLLQTQMNAQEGIYISKCVYKYRQDNVNASTYNKRGFYFINDEYEWAEQFLANQSTLWHISFYRKQFLHFMDRIYAMAASGTFWENAMPDMLAIARRLKGSNDNNILTEKILTEEHWKNLLLLWESPYFLYEKYRKVYEESRDALQRIIRFSADKRPIIIFGNGRLGQFIHAQLLYRGYKNIVAYCDNNKTIWGNLQYDIAILSPAQAVESFPEAKYIIANKKNMIDIWKQLESMGIERRDMMAYSEGMDMRLFGEICDEHC